MIIMHEMKSAYNIHCLCFNPVAIETIVSYFHEGDYVICGGGGISTILDDEADPKVAMTNHDYIYKLNQ